MEVGSLPQFHIAVQARTGVPAGVGVAQIAADKNLVLALMQRIGDVEPERRVAVLPLADFGAVDENGRIHVGPAEPKHAADAGHISDKEIFAVEQCAIAVQIVRVANLPIVGQVDGGELRVPRQQLGIRRAGGKTDYWEIYNYLPKETRGYVPAFIAANYVMTYYCKHNICPMETNIPDATDTIQVNRNLHFEQITDVCGIGMDEVKSLNPQYKKNIIPGDSKPQTLRLPINYISTFIDSQDTIYAHRSAELFKNRRTVSVANTRNTARSSKGKSSSQGNVTYHRIRNGETLSTIARKYGVTVSQIKSWNGLRSTRINAGKRLKIYK